MIKRNRVLYWLDTYPCLVNPARSTCVAITISCGDISALYALSRRLITTSLQSIVIPSCFNLSRNIFDQLIRRFFMSALKTLFCLIPPSPFLLFVLLFCCSIMGSLVEWCTMEISIQLRWKESIFNVLSYLYSRTSCLSYIFSLVFSTFIDRVFGLPEELCHSTRYTECPKMRMLELSSFGLRALQAHTRYSIIANAKLGFLYLIMWFDFLRWMPYLDFSRHTYSMTF